VARVLITGMSGVGKSSLLQELARRGYRTVDTDYGDFHETVDGERLWREDRIAALPAEAARCSYRARRAIRLCSIRFSTTSCCSAPRSRCSSSG
jgi:serine kinase of HPr protein (carbohydrate metabolism regulator)